MRIEFTLISFRHLEFNQFLNLLFCQFKTNQSIEAAVEGWWYSSSSLHPWLTRGNVCENFLDNLIKSFFIYASKIAVMHNWISHEIAQISFEFISSTVWIKRKLRVRIQILIIKSDSLLFLYNRSFLTTLIFLFLNQFKLI